TMMVSGCPGQTVCAPEDPEFDALVQVDQNDFWNPSGSAGVQIDAGDKVTFGLSAQAPVQMAGRATLPSPRPSSGVLAGATVSGDQADLDYWLPAVGRAGVEVRPTPRWHIELAGDIETWSEHKAMVITPDNMSIDNAPGVGSYQLGPMTVPRHFQNTYAGS